MNIPHDPQYESAMASFLIVQRLCDSLLLAAVAGLLGASQHLIGAASPPLDTKIKSDNIRVPSAGIRTGGLHLALAVERKHHGQQRIRRAGGKCTER